ncbi:MAG: putative membrane protein [Vicingaceae bacterium]|jgi:uncharacterized membrane protein
MFKSFYRNNRKFSETGFRYRGLDSSRLEHLTDAVFAFAITLLVIASEVPKTYVELQASMYDFIGFIACILMLLALWNNHASYFTKYGLQDKRTKALNFLFLFVLLFYIYPLKYLFSYIGSVQLINALGSIGFTSDAYQIALSKAIESMLSVDDWADIMIRFGLGLLAMHTILFGMFHNGYRKRKELKLNKREVYETKSSMIVFLSIMIICVISILVVVIGGGYYSAYSGMVYLAIPFSLIFIKKYRTRKMNELYPLKQKGKKWKRELKRKKKQSKKELRKKENINSAALDAKKEGLPFASSSAERIENQLENNENKTEE